MSLVQVTDEVKEASLDQIKTAPTEASAPENGDEQIGGMSLAEGEGEGQSNNAPQLTDPAILSMREAPKFRYSREVLLSLRSAPLSQRKPDFFDINEVTPTIWIFDRKKSETPTENGSRREDLGEHRKRRVGDPRERLRKENDGIVLSPQRRSFNSGCFVPVREILSTRPHSPLGKNEPAHMGVRERRIGSGRILRDTWDFGEKSDGDAGDFNNFRNAPTSNNQQSSNNRDDNTNRRTSSYNRDYDMNNGREKDKERRNNRYDNRRRINNDRDEEPEWFSGGPSSQNDTIELRGFDEPEKANAIKKKLSPSQSKRAKDWSKKKVILETTSVVEEKREKIDATIERSEARSTPNTQQQSNEQVKTAQAPETKATDKPGEQTQQFNFDDMLKCEMIPGLHGLLANGVGADGDNNTKSRFSQWFNVESPNKSTADSRRSSFQDNAIIKNLLKEINETSVSIPDDSSSYFAPISPAAATSGGVGGNAPSGSKTINIMEMLQRSNQQQTENLNVANEKPLPSQMMNLDELEAKMRQNTDLAAGVTAPMHKHSQKPAEDVAAFKRLLAQVNGGHAAATANGPMPPQKTQPMSLMEMLSHSQQQDEARMAAQAAAHLLGPSSPIASTTHLSNELALKLQQVQNQLQQKQQMETLTKLIGATGMQGMRTSHLPDIGVQQQSRELLNRPEAQAILRGLKRGDITPQHLYQQLANPALQPRHREMLVTILKMQGCGIGPSPRVLSPVPPHPMFQQQQQQLCVSPLPPNAYCVSPIMATSPNTLTVPAMHQRIPSPRELQVHTQNILQRALIKKKLEEQQENYRKKQEMQQRGQSPNSGAAPTTSNAINVISNVGGAQAVSKSVSSPTPLAFTPTSVLRKMTADKDDANKEIGKLDVSGKGRAVTGIRPQSQQQNQQQTAQQQITFGNWANLQNVKQGVGRPIVKANNIQPTQQTHQEQFFAAQQQRMFGQQQQQQQQQQRKSMIPPSQQQQYHGLPPHTSQYSNANQQFTQQQLRAQHQQQARPSNVPQSHQQLNFGNNQQQQGSWQQFLNTQQSGRGRGVLNDGELSPTTTNQLARWFSPDLLEKARIGELPSTAGLAQHALSLEEIERQTAPPVHN